jgi:hypothetical protein
MTEPNEQSPEAKQQIQQEQLAFDLAKALDLIDSCYHYLKANPPEMKWMTYNSWESLVERNERLQKI